MKRLLAFNYLCLVVFASCTKDIEPPTGTGNKVEVATTSISSISSVTALSGGSITKDGGSEITARGVCWNTAGNPTVSDNKSFDGGGLGSFTSSLTGLTPFSTYYVRAYATNVNGTSYGETITFKTLATLANIVTNSVTSVTTSSALSGGNILSNGGATITQRGICWSTSSNPTTIGSKTISGSGSGSFTASMTSLLPGTLYYVRAYAVSSIGTAYGNEQSFTTLATLATVSTNAINSPSTTSAQGGGFISSSGSSTVTQRGVCWSTIANPTISNNFTIDGSGIGGYNSNLNGLSAGTLYYVRAYAISNAGTAYGNLVSFTTATLPTVSTFSVSSITFSSAIAGGSVTSNGSSLVTQKGVCWSTTPSPTTSGARTIDGSGSGSFTSTLSSLMPNTFYYYRAYATSAAGTAYGAVGTFSTTNIGTPILSVPGSGSTLPCCTINFSWSFVSGATGYEIQISKSNTFSASVVTIGSCTGTDVPASLFVNKAIISSPSFCLRGGTSVNNGIWYWRVRATSGSYFGGWSSIRFYTYQS